ncbi:hypothetical protein ABH944_002030 [Caballeronia udeis]|uniref:Lipoprotein n=1 Tax=Caballeronia udeis TaxID=1232866 RepID=A0ABW8MFE0_9BURK
MLNILKMLAGRSSLRALSALAFCAVLLTGCAGGVTNVSAFPAASQVRPETIYVYTFASTPDQVKLDGGLLQKVKSQFDSVSTMQKQADSAVEVREQVADEIVKQLQSMGLHAVRADSPAPADRNVLIVQGSFDTIDAGNRRRRMLVGLGAGKSQVGTSVQVVYQPAGQMPRLVQSFDAKADSGKAPGVAETAGIGAAAGHVATSAAAGVGLHAVSETKHAGVSADAKRLADSIAKQLAQIGVAEGWMTPDRIKG